MRRCVLGLVLALGLLVAAPVAGAFGIVPTTRVYVSPATGGPHAVFRLRFRIPAATGTVGSFRRVDTLSISGPPRRGCVSDFTKVLAPAQTGARLRVKLDPSRLGGRWCAGSFQGQIVQNQSIVCQPQEGACPLLVIAPQTIASFAFRVTHSA
jgi:hypothetical protein